MAVVNVYVGRLGFATFLLMRHSPGRTTVMSSWRMRWSRGNSG